MARADLYIDPNRAGHSFFHEAELFRYVATHRANEVAFYCNIIATKGIAVYPNGRKGNVQIPCTDTTPNTKGYNGRRKQRYKYFRDAFGRHKGLLASNAAYIAEHGELIPAGKTADHVDGITTHNHPSNIRLLSNADNNRCGGYMRKLRNKGIHPEMFPMNIILRYQDRMQLFKATHTYYAYRHLTREDLLQMLVGNEYTIVTPDIIMDLDFERHADC